MRHTETHAAMCREQRRDCRLASTYESDGSDGYSPGTWGYLVSVGGWATDTLMFGGGGYPDREMAAEASRGVAV